MQHLAKRQRGLGITGWIFVIAIALFFALLGMKMVPHYLQYYSIAEVLESIAQDPAYKNVPSQELRKAFDRRIDINGVYDFPRKGLRIVADPKGGKKMVVDYEIREPMAGNVDVVMHFHREVTVK